jgi:cytoskeletal protein CcmA (bactofilin family)
MIALLALSACQSTDAESGILSATLVFDGSHTFTSGDVVDGALLILDGQVSVDEGARVEGSVFMVAGEASVGGVVGGDVSVIGGRMTVNPEAEILGDLRAGNAELLLSSGARIRGEVLTGGSSGLEPEALFPERPLERELFLAVLQAILLALVSLAVVRFIPGPADRVMEAALRHPIVSAAMGVLVAVVGLVLFVIMAFTLILIPVSVIGVMVGFFSVGYGWIGIGIRIGRWFRDWRGWENRPGMQAFVGTLLLVLPLNLVALIPYIGDVINLLLISISLGAVILTRFGLREFVPAGEAEALL